MERRAIANLLTPQVSSLNSSENHSTDPSSVQEECAEEVDVAMDSALNHVDDESNERANSLIMRKQLIVFALACYMQFMMLLFQGDNSSTHIHRSYHLWLDQCYLVLRGLDGRSARRSPNIWCYDRPATFMERTLMQSYSDGMFKKRLRLCKQTFEYICQELGPLLKREDTKMRLSISVETKVCIALSRLATGNTITEIADNYAVGYTTAQRAILDFCFALKEKLHRLCIKWPSSERFQTLAQEFEKLKGIPYVVGAIDGSHIPIIAPVESREDYYNRKGFYSIILQIIVSSSCLIWDYDMGWPGSLHDWKVFESSNAGRRIMNNGRLKKYCLVGDAAYPPRPWMLSPFKGYKDGLNRMEYNWNYLQSSTRMPVECAFGMLKSRFRILLKRMDVRLEFVPAIVTACLILHNLCIFHRDKFDDDWITEATKELERSIASEETSKRAERRLKRLKISGGDIANAAAYGIHSVRGVDMDPLEALARALEEDVEDVVAVSINGPQSQKDANASNAARRNALARALYLQTYGAGDEDDRDASS